jgi:hypothetical protein
MSRIAARSKQTGDAFAYNLGAIALAIGLGAVGLAYGIDGAARQMSAADRPGNAGGTLARVVGGQELTIPTAWFRYEERGAEGFSRQVDLSLTLPLGAEGSPVPVDVSLQPRSGVRPSSGLLDGVYLHMFQPQQIAGPPGLIGKPLRDMDGYLGETVWYDPLSAEPFVAKCIAPVAEGAASRCLRAVYLSPGLAAVYGFDASMLWAWRDFDAAMSEKLRTIGAAS